MSEYDNIDARLRTVEQWQAKHGSILHEVRQADACISELKKRFQSHEIKFIQLEASVENAKFAAIRAQEIADKNDRGESTWIGKAKDRLWGIGATISVGYVAIQLAFPNAIERFWLGVGAFLAGPPQ